MGTCALSIESETTHIGTNNIAATSQSCQSQPFTQVCLSIVEDHPECPQPFQMVNLFRPPPSLGRQCRSQAWLLQLEDPFGVSTSEIPAFRGAFRWTGRFPGFQNGSQLNPPKTPNMFFFLPDMFVLFVLGGFNPPKNMLVIDPWRCLKPLTKSSLVI